MPFTILAGSVLGIVVGWGARWSWTLVRRRHLRIARLETGELLVSLEPGTKEELEHALHSLLVDFDAAHDPAAVVL